MASAGDKENGQVLEHWELIAWSNVLHVVDPSKTNRAFCGLPVPADRSRFNLGRGEYRKCRNCVRMLQLRKEASERAS